MTFIPKPALFLFLAVLKLMFLLLAVTPPSPQKTRPPAPPADARPAAEDISGMYSFLKEGEFLQINLDQNGVSGYISRHGDLESDQGAFLDQFFSEASVHGHDVAFVTKPVHSVWFEFKGRFDRGPAKTKKEDGYYVLRGTLKEFTTGADKNTSTRSREAEFKLLAQPDEEEHTTPPPDRPKKWSAQLELAETISYRCESRASKSTN